MNSVAEEIRAVLESEYDDELMHYGMPRRSGRYPWGSGDSPYQRSADFISRIEELKKTGWSETPEDIRKEFNMTTSEYRAFKAIAKDERRMLVVARAKSLKDDGLGDTDIARKLSDELGRSVNESTVRSWLNSESEAKMNAAKATADFIKKQIDEKGMVDIGVGVERELNVSKEKLQQALVILEAEGYPVYGGRIDQTTNPSQKTTMKVVCPPGTAHKDIYDAFNKGEVSTLNEYISRDGGDTYEKKFTYPESMDSKRVMIRYADDVGPDGHKGIEKDGVVELRRGVEDLSLGESRYSQVRILVEGTHYIKGMAVYSDNLPDGVDAVFNTNKKAGTPMCGPKDNTVLKVIKKDPDNPFGSAIKDAEQGGQYWYTGKDGKKHLGLINKRADEGDWTDWKDALPSQFLAKQSKALIQKQLDAAYLDKHSEYDEICSLTNPTVKKHLLQKFSDECDSAAVHLQAAALPGQKYHVIIPISSLKDTEVYAPNYPDGSDLALIRYPHAGTFEIPILKVNNKHKVAREILGTDVTDAIGINSQVAERLSGADFDGDTVMCIPTNTKGIKIASTPKLKGLENFDPKTKYGPESYKGREIRLMKNTGTQMGIISNLITDMTIKGASEDELARAVRHSMVVIDAEKHKLDYKKSEIDNNIAGLKKDYQTYVDANGKKHVGGASTLLSRSKGEMPVLKRQGSPIIDPETGKQSWKVADDVNYEVTRTNKRTGEVSIITKQRTQKSTRMFETDDARTLISEYNSQAEQKYADYANKMKALANDARKTMLNTGKIKYSATSKETYRSEVNSLLDKLSTAELNAPRERMANLKANAEVIKKTKEYKEQHGEDMKASEVKKLKQQSLSKYRETVGSVSRRDRSIKITDKEWEAIQAGAISENVLTKILKNTDVDSLRQRATPRAQTTLSSSKVSRIKAMKASNYTLEQIATALGVSTSTVSDYLKGENK